MSDLTSCCQDDTSNYIQVLLRRGEYERLPLLRIGSNKLQYMKTHYVSTCWLIYIAILSDKKNNSTGLKRSKYLATTTVLIAIMCQLQCFVRLMDSLFVYFMLFLGLFTRP
ncbi:Uncharacterized protein HZ326_27929 [Fusarium oxysporum f. sp. albedinis]|nr:Uncharacterized protein HZ326_27929 [Fusarium oxysporum f. sp. albedinis]